MNSLPRGTASAVSAAGRQLGEPDSEGDAEGSSEGDGKVGVRAEDGDAIVKRQARVGGA